MSIDKVLEYYKTDCGYQHINTFMESDFKLETKSNQFPSNEEEVVEMMINSLESESESSTMSDFLNKTFSIKQTVSLSNEKHLFNEMIINKLEYKSNLGTFLALYYQIMKNESVTIIRSKKDRIKTYPNKKDYDRNEILLDLEILSMYQLFHNSYLRNVHTIYNKEFSEKFSEFIDKLFDFIVVQVIGIDKIIETYRHTQQYIQENILHKIMEVDIFELCSRYFAVNTQQEAETKLNKFITELFSFIRDITNKYSDVKNIFPDIKDDVLRDIKSCVTTCISSFEGNILEVGVTSDLYKKMFEEISKLNLLNSYCKTLTNLSKPYYTYELKKKSNGNVNSSIAVEYTFKEEDLTDMYRNVLKYGSVTIDITNSIDSLYYYVLSKKLLKTDMKYNLKENFINDNVMTITKIKNIMENLSNNIIENKKNIINSYKNCFRGFVIDGCYTDIGIGAYLISLLILPHVPIKYITKYVNKLDITEEKLKNYLDSHSIEETVKIVVKKNIMEIINKKPEEVDEFGQAPYMLGLFTFMNPERTAGTCQDSTLLQLMVKDKNNELYGMELKNYPDITHWQIIHSSNTQFEENGIAIIHDRVILSNSLGTRYTTKKEYEKNANQGRERTSTYQNKTLRRFDVQKIEKSNYQARANIFLAMTLAHVYRHTFIRNFNDDNGVAFYQNLGSYKNGFEGSVLKYIEDEVIIPSKGSRDDNFFGSSSNKYKVEQFCFKSIKEIFSRKFEAILKSNHRERRASVGGSKKTEHVHKKYGIYKNRIIYKKNNSYYVKVRTNDGYVFKRIKSKEINFRI